MISVSTLYDEYIDRPKLSEQKNPFEYIVPPPSRGVGTITVLLGILISSNICGFDDYSWSFDVICKIEENK